MGLVEYALLFVLFAEPGFPTAGIDGPLPDLQGVESAQVLVVEDAAALAAALQPGRVLVWRHGGAFPAESWPAIERFLAEGGSLLHLGGPIFSHPVYGPAGDRRVRGPEVSTAKHLGLNPGGSQLVSGARQFDFDEGATVQEALPAGTTVTLLEPRFSDEKLRKEEEGSPGPRDAVLRPITHLALPDDDPRFPAAAGSVAIDRLRGRFAGGRWTLRLLSSPPTSAELARLVAIAARPPFELALDPDYGSFHDEESPSVRIHLRRPAPWADPAAKELALELRAPGGGWERLETKTLGPKSEVLDRIVIDRTEPGIYSLRGTIDGEPIGSVTTTGFWIFDPVTFASGGAISIEGDHILRDGVPQIGIGTTVMSRSVHREFLEKPNAAEWDATFEELASLGVRWVRTGVWSGWNDIVDGREINESWMRALEAYYLTARRHDIGVIFTFFSFAPPPFEGRSPYFERRIIAKQAHWLKTVAERFAPARTIIWDLINEPSFADPMRLWVCRPSSARADRQTFFRWLELNFSQPEYGAAAEEKGWQEVVRHRWRLRADEPLRVPLDPDFEDKSVFGDARPYRAREYIRFAAYAFSDWALLMRRVIREAGSEALITVGQDEGGLNDRPSPLLHQDAVDFTSIHTWWYDDAQLWDVVLARVPGKPCWVTETLLMRREDLSGEIFRTSEERAHLFARKLALPFAAGATHVFSWAYDVNPYLDSDNEVSIGLRRVDGSYTPEHRVFRTFARGFAERGASLLPPAEPTLSVLFPTPDHRSPRDLLRAGTQRLVNILFELGHRPRWVHEDRAAFDLPEGGTVVVPSCRGILPPAWEKISRTGGGFPDKVVVSGWFEKDDVGHPARRLGVTARPIAQTEWVGERTLTFPLAVTQSARAAVAPEEASASPLGWTEPSPGVHHHPLPIDFAHGTDVVRDLYREILGAPDESGPGRFIVPLPREGGRAWVVVSQSGRAFRAERDGIRFEVAPRGAAVVWLDGSDEPVVSGIGVRAVRP